MFHFYSLSLDSVTFAHMASLEQMSSLGKRQLHKCGQWAKHGIDQAKSFLVAHEAASDPKLVLFGAVLLCLVAWLLLQAIQRLRRPSQDILPPPILETGTSSFKAPPRKPGGRCESF
jgi:hypothetical protein